MNDIFLAEVRLFSFPQTPKSWAQCNGQFLPINQNQALFALLGTMYGGNGQTTFALPELRGRCVMHVGNSLDVQGQSGGEEVHTLTISEMPQHVHLLSVSTLDANVPIATGNRLAAFNNGYIGPANLVSIAPETVGNTGGSQAHNNMSPYIAVNFCIALQGLFPSQN